MYTSTDQNRQVIWLLLLSNPICEFPSDAVGTSGSTCTALVVEDHN